MAREIPSEVDDFAGQAVDYVRRSLGITLSYDSETLPVLDHYVRQIPNAEPALRDLVIATAGAYYGEVVRRALGGSWRAEGQPSSWRLVLPGGLSFAPAGFVAAAMVLTEVDDYDSAFEAPPALEEIFEAALARMAPVTEEQYYSLCGRFDTLEHVQDALFARAQQKRAELRERDE